MALERIAAGTGAILYEPSRLDHPTPADFDPAALGAAGRITGTATGRGSAWFVAPRSGAATVLRHYRRGGLIARLVADRYLWRGEEATRAFRELRLLATLEALGLPAARPVAARYRRSGLLYRADLITLAIPGARSLADRLADPAVPWARIGATLRAFHDAGACHADLNARNVLIDAEGGVHLIDFDRGTLAAPGRWRERNLERLQRSLVKIGGRRPEGWTALLDGYRTPRSTPRR
ncbi:MAG TPA: 3-deoxy-D-manno-octulosonic acid kinase [Steroidobacteraceae bacterium]|nr:3-deoxy-D-manno-octulosonic acid kinase [Steroidobacteraceae bacterium]